VLPVTEIAVTELMTLINWHAQILANLTAVVKNTGLDQTLYSQITPHLDRLAELHGDVAKKARDMNIVRS
jgi:hypothetical protein